MSFSLKSWLLMKYHEKRAKCKIGRNSFVDRHTKLGGHNYIGENCVLREVSFGHFSYVANNAKLTKFRCGNYCSIGNNFKTGLGLHPKNFVSSHPVFYGEHMTKSSFDGLETLEFESHEYTDTAKSWFVECGHDVWIGDNVTIKDGVVINSGAIIGTNSLVLQDVEPYAIYAGSPARKISFRFQADEIDRLMKLQWWHWNESRIRQELLYFRNVTTFLDRNEY